MFLLDEAENVLVPAACDVQDFRDEVMALRLPLGQGVTGNVALTGRGEIVNSALDDPRAVQVPGTPVEQSALLCVPLLVREKVAGAITLTRIGDRIFLDEDLELATLFAGQCSAAISNARLYEEIRRAYHELREAQSQLVQSAKLNALGEMAGGVAHDFNNILAAILGRTQLLLQGVSDAERAPPARGHRAGRAGRRAGRAPRAGVHAPAPGRALRGAGREGGAAGRARADALGLGGRVQAARHRAGGRARPAGAAQSVAGNASELREVFTNLVLNALDAMPWGGTLTLSSADADGEVCIRVTDTGVGMDAETRGARLRPVLHHQAGQGHGARPLGGLRHHHAPPRPHRGRLRAGPRQRLQRLAAGGARRAQAKPAPAPDGPLPRLRVLAVDDEEPVLQVLGDLLAVLGQDVEIALGGAAGLERYSPERFDVVFTDLGMPGVNGWDVVQAVKSRSPETPVVIVTGWGAQIEGRALHARGAST